MAGHGKDWRATSDGVCGRCMEEYQAGRRPYLEIRRWNAAAPFDCPGCLSEVVEPTKRRKVPGELRRLFEAGMIPSHVMDFRNAARRARLALDECLQSEGKAHMLFPTIDYEMNNVNDRRSVFRDGNRFVSADQRISTTYSCFHCGHPIHIPNGCVTPMEPTDCPRCLRRLQECVYCTHTDHKLFTPRKANDGTERCPRCDNLMARVLCDFNAAALKGLTHPAHCLNLLTCRAGSRPWSTATELHNAHCCCSADAGQPVPLLRHDLFEAEVDRCPLCLSLVGQKDAPKTPDGEIIPLAADGILDHFADRNAVDLRAPCAICSAKPIAVLKWMSTSGYFNSLPNREYDEKRQKMMDMAIVSDPVPRLDARNGLDILNTIRRTSDTTLLYSALTHLLGRSFTPSATQQDLDGLYTQQSPCQRALALCFSQLEQEHLRRQGRGGACP